MIRMRVAYLIEDAQNVGSIGVERCRAHRLWKRIRAVERPPPTGPPVWGDRPAAAGLSVRAPIDLIAIGLPCRARPRGDRVDGSRSVVHYHVACTDLAN